MRFRFIMIVVAVSLLLVLAVTWQFGLRPHGLGLGDLNVMGGDASDESASEQAELAQLVAEVQTPEVFTQPTDAQRLAAVGNLEQVRKEWRPFFQPNATTRPVPDPQEGDWLAKYPEQHQSFDLFLKQRPNRPDQERGTIYLLPLDEFEEYVPQLEDLRDFMQRYFAMPTKVLPRHTFPMQRITERISPQTQRTQWLTSDLLAELKPLLPQNGYCMLGVTMTDLYPKPEWNYVFGQATLKDRVGIYSFSRFDPKFWGEERTPEARVPMLQRSCQLIAHETGHMFGLRHCVYYQCAMNGCNNQPESDSHPLGTCPVCTRKLHWSIGFDPVQRERELAEVYQRLEITARPLVVAKPK